jgi:small subunit ribosomal protein S20
MRQTATRRARNRAQRSSLRSAVKKVRGASNREEAEAAFQQAQSLLDQAARKGLIARNAAARNKRRLHKIVAAKTG